MTTYRITNRATGIDYGVYPGETAEAAIAAMLRDSGYDVQVDRETDPETLLITGGLEAWEAKRQEYRLIDTTTRKVVATASSEAEALAHCPYLPADCVDGAETWEEVLEAARRHADGVPGVVEGYCTERVSGGVEDEESLSAEDHALIKTAWQRLVSDVEAQTPTPGPWEAHDDDGTGTLPCVLSEHVNPSGTYYVGQFNRYADALLCSAAPDLARALEAALPLLADSLQSASQARQAEIQAASAAARAALRAAGYCTERVSSGGEEEEPLSTEARRLDQRLVLDATLYEAAQGAGGPWALDVDQETSEPLRVRYDGDPRIGAASVFKTATGHEIISAGRRAKAAGAALKRARAEWVKATAGRLS